MFSLEGVMRNNDHRDNARIAGKKTSEHSIAGKRSCLHMNMQRFRLILACTGILMLVLYGTRAANAQGIQEGTITGTGERSLIEIAVPEFKAEGGQTLSTTNLAQVISN